MLKPQLITRSELFSRLEQGAILLTGNLRLCRFLGQAHAEHAAAQKQVVWLTPEVIPLKDWMLQVRETLLINGQIKTGIILNPQQEILLWETIIRNSPEGEALLRPHATARQVQQAWQLLHDWRLEEAADTHDLNEDAQAFLNWCTSFRATCQDKGWISPAQVSNQLSVALRQNNPFVDKTIMLAGFDELTPQQQALFSVLKELGTEIFWQLPEAPSTESGLFKCVDERDEILQMAGWLRQQLNVKPEISIAVIVPNLEQRRAAIVRELSSVLACESAPLFNLSLGRSLSQYPLIQTAFYLLACLHKRIDLATASALLCSPFIRGWELESSSRALLDRRLRETGEPDVSLNTLIYFSTQEASSWFSPLFAEQLRALSQFIDTLPAKNNVGHWAEQFSRYLAVAGWSSGRSLSSEEFQTLEAWQKLLAAFARLDLVSNNIKAQEALAYLRQQASEQTFQAESAAAPVQVLGLYEASGLQFDALWLMGMSDAVWPATARPNPFISLALQRQHEMPHATATRELIVARQLTQRLLTSAATVIVSYPASETGNETLRPSTLFKNLPRLEKSDLSCWQGESWQDLIQKNKQLELLSDDAAPAIDLEHEKVRGGSSIIRLQSNCPFHAFAELRLGARPFAQVDIGLDAMSRGTLMHRVLELVWDTLESQACLLQIEAENKLITLVEDMIRMAIKEMQQALPQSFSHEYLKLESSRLQGYVMRWLELEKQRAPFHLHESERLIETQIKGIPIRLKLDRVDKLDEGGYLVIDYKTGSVTASQWFGERPEEPQLPLYAQIYAHLLDEELQGLVFAQLSAKELGFKGISADGECVPKVKAYTDMKQTREMSSWSAVLDNWKNTVENLALDFKAGKAEVDPLKEGNSCRYCELNTLCRIHEQNILQENMDGVQV
ncbi:hypothetical protein MNBD_GAMMA25-2656 [hydrothermal vent metagenome]|uniref:PD-(D/E)XK endonuclease-like domain-containing protein n=1 Tax=hydrothermal vent metagenome TaxID=652676 RepID=A0A3B1BRS1_9ZZZZ